MIFSEATLTSLYDSGEWMSSLNPGVSAALHYEWRLPRGRWRLAIPRRRRVFSNSPQSRGLVPAANGGQRRVPPTLIPNAAMRGIGGRHGGRAPGRGDRTDAVLAALTEAELALSLHPGAL
jgi:hypothetical protein